MKVKLYCPMCGWRLMDAEANISIELKAPIHYEQDGWKPDLYQKCKKCGIEVSLKINK